ncbi:MAG: hypothetical protein E7160_03385 [Firmicutes bacterium]|nr:hypothetical protein [Bacillota bacterium]
MNSCFERNLRDVVASFQLDYIDVPDYMIDAIIKKHNNKEQNNNVEKDSNKLLIKKKGIYEYEDKRRNR